MELVHGLNYQSTCKAWGKRQPHSGQLLICRAGSDGRRNTVQCVDSTVFPPIEPICLPVLGQTLARVVFRLI